MPPMPPMPPPPARRSAEPGATRSCAGQLTLSHDALVRFIRALNSIFGLAASAGKSLGHLISPARGIAAGGSPQEHRLADLEFVRHHTLTTLKTAVFQ